MMKIDMIKYEERAGREEYAEFYMDGIRHYYLNSLRRSALTEVPVLAIHDVIIHQNTSSLFDDVLSNRLGLIPLTAAPSEIDVLGECSKAGLNYETSVKKCSARLKLQKRGEKEGITVVHAKDIEAVDKESVQPVNGDIPVVKLGKDQEIDVEMIAKVGRGKDHSKWNPTETNGYKPLPGFYVKESCTGCGECVEACPKEILKMKGGRPLLTEIGRYECDLGQICTRVCPEDALMLAPAEEAFIYKVSTVGQHSLDNLLAASLDGLSRKAVELLEVLQNEMKGKNKEEQG